MSKINLIDNFVELLHYEEDMQTINKNWFKFKKLDENTFNTIVKLPAGFTNDDMKYLDQHIEDILKIFPPLFPKILLSRENGLRNTSLDNKKLDNFL